jgi:hypothetical protein
MCALAHRFPVGMDDNPMQIEDSAKKSESVVSNISPNVEEEREAVPALRNHVLTLR